MSIKINNISKSFDQTQVLDSISFEAKPGDIVGLLGPNGAGKSTMMKIITGYYQQDSGNISICGKDTLIDEIFVKKKIGYLSEENPLYPEMYVQEFLEFICDIYKIEYEHCVTIIQLTGLEEVKYKKIKTLSKGFQQRVGIAQALIHNPELIVLDEPTSGLDPKQLIEIRKIITNIGKEKTKNQNATINGMNLMCSKLFLSKPKGIVSGKIKKYKTNNSIGIDPM